MLKDRWINLMHTVPDDIVLDNSNNEKSGERDDGENPANDNESALFKVGKSPLSTIVVDHSSEEEHSYPSINSFPERSKLGLSLENETTLEIHFSKRSPTKMACFDQNRKVMGRTGDAHFFHQSFPDSISIAKDFSTERRITPLPVSLRNTCEKFSILRETLHLSKHDHEKSRLPTHQTVFSRDSYTDGLSRLQLKTSVAWLCLQVGFTNANQVPLSCLTDVTAQFIRDICRSIKLYIEFSGLLKCGCKDENALTMGDLLVRRLARDYYGGAGKLVRVLADDPIKLQWRLDSAIANVRERQNRDETNGLVDGNMISDADLDLELLGEEWTTKVGSVLPMQMDDVPSGSDHPSRDFLEDYQAFDDLSLKRPATIEDGDPSYSMSKISRDR